MKRRLTKLEFESDYFAVRFTLQTEQNLRQKILQDAKHLQIDVTITKSKSLLIVKLKKQLICTHHDNIVQLCSEASLLTDNKELQIMLRKIECAAIDAKKIGQRMEDRLREYHDTIESLGFKRKRNHSITIFQNQQNDNFPKKTA